MNIQVNKSHLIAFAGFMVVLALAIYVGYPKFQQQKEKQALDNFYGISTADTARS